MVRPSKFEPAVALAPEARNELARDTPRPDQILSETEGAERLRVSRRTPMVRPWQRYLGEFAPCPVPVIARLENYCWHRGGLCVRDCIPDRQRVRFGDLGRTPCRGMNKGRSLRILRLRACDSLAGRVLPALRSG